MNPSTVIPATPSSPLRHYKFAFFVQVSPTVILTELTEYDRDDLVAILQDQTIHQNTLVLPNPYKPADFDWWLAHCRATATRQKRHLKYAIRDATSLRIIGSTGFHDVDWVKDVDGEVVELGEGKRPWKVELGYYLSSEYRGRGIMPAVIAKLLELAFTTFHLARVSAIIFAHNAPSGRVLEKCGFTFEGTLRKWHRKDGALIDAKVYCILKEEWEERRGGTAA
ncbi:acyl-CoA N-acyltransferase [Gonapodya prolifera JEL478]|uniref:Acyl-CoA N-acyltransferase n=1 Tax=Gonapodya prolifera (strain JEL478) TaxID=1344416 RepID=A0A139AKB5_GONPJ|nr:acyl-CoA N-acyltransferase [Gonapodya prolifera JEL478]|eukprot:KXS17232.1 acyl-CoA N-acyltransferase [Gonapodya prolifera JEL478]